MCIFTSISQCQQKINLRLRFYCHNTCTGTCKRFLMFKCSLHWQLFSAKWYCNCSFHMHIVDLSVFFLIFLNSFSPEFSYYFLVADLVTCKNLRGEATVTGGAELSYSVLTKMPTLQHYCCGCHCLQVLRSFLVFVTIKLHLELPPSLQGRLTGYVMIGNYGWKLFRCEVSI